MGELAAILRDPARCPALKVVASLVDLPGLDDVEAGWSGPPQHAEMQMTWNRANVRVYRRRMQGSQGGVEHQLSQEIQGKQQQQQQVERGRSESGDTTERRERPKRRRVDIWGAETGEDIHWGPDSGEEWARMKGNVVKRYVDTSGSSLVAFYDDTGANVKAAVAAVEAGRNMEPLSAWDRHIRNCAGGVETRLHAETVSTMRGKIGFLRRDESVEMWDDLRTVIAATEAEAKGKRVAAGEEDGKGEVVVEEVVEVEVGVQVTGMAETEPTSMNVAESAELSSTATSASTSSPTSTQTSMSTPPSSSTSSTSSSSSTSTSTAVCGVGIFDFDLTLSDAHTGGYDLRTTAAGKVEVHTRGRPIRSFMDSPEREERLVERLNAMPCARLVVLSRGLVDPLVEAFTALGFEVVRHGMRRPRGKDKRVT